MYLAVQEIAIHIICKYEKLTDFNLVVEKVDRQFEIAKFPHYTVFENSYNVFKTVIILCLILQGHCKYQVIL